MKTISDLIEEFILSNMGEDEYINLSRNELAEFFNCAPSQINYVLSTRFKPNRGFVIESQRGGGGYIKLIKAKFDDNILEELDEKLGDAVSYKDATVLLLDLEDRGIITREQQKVVLYAIAPKAISTPIKIEDNLRAKILKNVLINILKDMEE